MHQEAITLEAKKIFDSLACFPNFYLADGTGLPLHGLHLCDWANQVKLE